jgi:hypothetical protein
MQGKLFHGTFYVIDLYIGTMIKKGGRRGRDSMVV